MKPAQSTRRPASQVIEMLEEEYQELLREIGKTEDELCCKRAELQAINDGRGVKDESDICHRREKKDEVDRLEDTLAELLERKRLAKIVEPSSDRVGLGPVTVYYTGGPLTGQRKTVTIVSNGGGFGSGHVSINSPFGMAIAGKKLGELASFSPKTGVSHTIKIVKIGSD